MTSRRNDLEDEHEVRCDIGSFVVAVERMKASFKPIKNVLEYLIGIVRWKKPFVSFLYLILFCGGISLFPEQFAVLLLCPVPGWMILSLIRNKWNVKRSQSQSVNLMFKRRNQSPELVAKQAAMQRAQEHLLIYLDILIAIQTICNDVSDQVDFAYSVYCWKKSRLSFLLFATVMLVMFALCLFELRSVIASAVFLVFICNSGFKRVILGLIGACTPTNLFRRKQEEIDETVDIQYEQDFVRQIGRQVSFKREPIDSDGSPSSGSETETEIQRTKDGSPVSTLAPQGFSIGSKLANFRKRVKKLNSGNCTSCSVAFSTILKKRQYCRHCGNSFCSKCCRERVPRAVFGATAPAAHEQRVLVCNSCHRFLTNRLKSTVTEIIG